MTPDEIGIEIIPQLAGRYQFEGGRWIHLRGESWTPCLPPRREIWAAMIAHKPDVTPSKPLADDIQNYLEAYADDFVYIPSAHEPTQREKEAMSTRGLPPINTKFFNGSGD